MILPTTIWLACCLTGCATPIEIPQWDIEPQIQNVTFPVEPPEKPVPSYTTDTEVTFDLEAFRALVAWSVVAEGNYDIAQANAVSLQHQIDAYNALLEAGKLQQQMSEIREEQLQLERNDHTMDNWFYRGIIAVGIIAVLSTQ